MTNRLVIVGGGQAAFACAARLRALGDQRPISMICGEQSLPYQRPPLSKKYLTGEMTLDRLLFRPEEWYNDNAVDIRLGISVRAIDRAAKHVTLSDNTILSYDKLALATGSSPRQLPQSLSNGLDGIYTIRNFADADRLRPAMKPGRKLLVIGGGYIGLEAAAVARQHEMDVVLVEAAERILARVAAPSTADTFRQIHTARGVRILEGVGVSQLEGRDGHIAGANLSNGENVAADMVIAGIGASAEDQIARDAGIECANGILVDGAGRTSDTDIYAMGDCALQIWKGQRVRLESVQNAVDQADIVAENLAGQASEYHPKPWFWSDQYDVKLQIAGFNLGYDDTVMRQGQKEGASSLWYFAGDDLIAVDAVNDGKAYVVGKKLLDSGKVTGLKSAISDPSFDLKSLI